MENLSKPIHPDLSPGAPQANRAAGEYAPGRLNAGGPVAVIDIGSNSVRLVIYEQMSRTPTTFFNEKVLAGLGRGVAGNGRLSDESIDAALRAIRRFRHLCTQSNVEQLYVLATAAARDADNGAQFISRVEDITGVPVAVLSGRQEATYAAYGVMSGIWQPDGIVGDLGGGSLELIDIHGADIGVGKTVALGTLRLQEASGDSPRKAGRIVEAALDGVDFLQLGLGRHFYAVGGTWRSMARLHMHQIDYPLHVMHQYTMAAAAVLELCEQLIAGDPAKIAKMGVISTKRRPLLPYGALVMRAILQKMQPADVTISALGVREGLLYERMSNEERARDPLLAACEELAFLRSRSPRHAHELGRWTDVLFGALDIDESAQERRLRHAACLLADTGWRAHPDYRGDQSLSVIANAAFVGIDHGGRAYLSMAAHYRHVGLVTEQLKSTQHRLANDRLIVRARILGVAIRVAYLLSAAMPGIILRTRFEGVGDVLRLVLPPDLGDLDGERVSKRLDQLARLVNRKSEVMVA